VRSRFAELSEKAGGAIVVEAAEGHEDMAWRPVAEFMPELEAAVFERGFDDMWRRTSYSGITADAHDPRVGSEPDERLVTDEPPPQAAAVTGQEQDDHREALETLPLMLSSMPGGVEVGSFIHAVFEEVDFASPDLEGELATGIATASGRRSLDLGDRGLVVAGLMSAISTPLGDVVEGTRLCDISRSDRIDEMSFELPLAGGDNPSGTISVTDIANLLRSHLDHGDALTGYAERLDDPALARDLRGYLTGSIDLVFRFGGKRLCIVDYKTNHLAPPAEPVTPWHYRPEALTEEMYRAHYPLQAILYAVAFHRYMRWRDPHYDVATDFAGVLYLFVRGMSNPTFPAIGGIPCGVWSWRPPATLIEELSNLFDEGANT
jgi:exodeoxyribonuclease V beta subunit